MNLISQIGASISPQVWVYGGLAFLDENANWTPDETPSDFLDTLSCELAPSFRLSSLFLFWPIFNLIPAIFDFCPKHQQ